MKYLLENKEAEYSHIKEENQIAETCKRLLKKGIVLTVKKLWIMPPKPLK